MSEPTICTIEQLKQHLKCNVSEKRYLHSLGVADTTEFLLKHYNVQADVPLYNGFSAGYFCGIAHDLAREFSDIKLIEYCKENNILLDRDELESPVLAHGTVSADIAVKLCGQYPALWKRAIAVHTTGDSNMDSLALALFCADYIEPSRVFMTEEIRALYLSEPSIEGCAYRILCDMINHWKSKGFHDASEKSLAMKSWLEAI